MLEQIDINLIDMRLRFKNITNKRIFTKPIIKENNKVVKLNNDNKEIIPKEKKEETSVINNSPVFEDIKEEKKSTSKGSKKVVSTEKNTKNKRNEKTAILIENNEIVEEKNNTEKIYNNMENMDYKKLEELEAAVNDNINSQKHVKVVKKDRGLIERTESSRVILTEDNRQVLND